jgi:hypothetical protein
MANEITQNSGKIQTFMDTIAMFMNEWEVALGVTSVRRVKKLGRGRWGEDFEGGKRE